MENPYASVPLGARVAVLAELRNDHEGQWLSYPPNPHGAGERSYGAVPISFPDSTMQYRMECSGLVRTFGYWDQTSLCADDFEPVTHHWSDPYRTRPDGIDHDHVIALLATMPEELEARLNAVEHFHPDKLTRKVEISVPLASRAWDDWIATVQPWIQLQPIMEILS